MEKIKDFHFYNLVLAAKHWYVRGDYPRLNNANGFTYKHMHDMADKIFGK